MDNKAKKNVFSKLQFVYKFGDLDKFVEILQVVN